MFTATAVMQLVETGKIRLDDRVSAYIPWFKSNKDSRLAKVTIRQLLSHGSGFIRDGEECDYWQLLEPFPSGVSFRSQVTEGRVVYEVNERLKYSNYGFTALGFVIQKASGKSYNQYVSDHIVKPLRMRTTGPELDERSRQSLAVGYSRRVYGEARRPLPHVSTHAMSSATGFYSSVEDLFRFGDALSFGNKTILSDDSKREMQRIHYQAEGDEEDKYYGLGMGIRKIGERKLVGHSGGFPGFATNTRIDPEERLVIVALTNAIDVPADGITQSMVEIINFFQDKAGAKQNRELDRYTGRFHAMWGTIDVIRAADKLYAVWPTARSPFQQPTELEVKSKTRLLIKKGNPYDSIGEDVTYRFDSTGKPRSIRWGGMSMYPWAEYKERFA